MPQNTFTSRIESNITRISPDGKRQEFYIKDYPTAMYLFDLQKNGYSFEIPKVAVHFSDSKCIACE